MSSMHRIKLVGSTRTYVYTGDRGLDADAGSRGSPGRAFVSTGPLVELTVNGMIARRRNRAAGAAAATSTSPARVRSITPLDSVTLVFNGEAVENIPLTARSQER